VVSVNIRFLSSVIWPMVKNYSFSKLL